MERSLQIILSIMALAIIGITIFLLYPSTQTKNIKELMISPGPPGFELRNFSLIVTNLPLEQREIGIKEIGTGNYIYHLRPVAYVEIIKFNSRKNAQNYLENKKTFVEEKVEKYEQMHISQFDYGNVNGFLVNVDGSNGVEYYWDTQKLIYHVTGKSETENYPLKLSKILISGKGK